MLKLVNRPMRTVVVVPVTAISLINSTAERYQQCRLEVPKCAVMKRLMVIDVAAMWTNEVIGNTVLVRCHCWPIDRLRTDGDDEYLL